jgi:hypothetical protein
MGGALGAGMLTAIPIIDASAIKEPWYGLIMIAIGMVPFIPMIRFLKARRDRDMRLLPFRGVGVAHEH